MRFGRVLTAMVTPFHKEGKINLEELESLVEHLLSTGTEGLVVCGTTGESATLSKEEKEFLFHYVKTIVNDRAPVIAGVGSNDTKTSIELAEKASEMGMDGVMVVTPYYNKPSQEGMYQHFVAIANATNLPVMLYNVPGRTGVQLQKDTVVRLSQIPNITSIKDASGDLVHMSEIIRDTNDDFILYCGDDALTLPALSVGAYGVISVASHVIGNTMKQMISHHLNGSYEAAKDLHLSSVSMMKELFAYPSPSPVKAALRELHVCNDYVRLPLVPLKEEEKKTLKSLLKNKSLL